MLNILLGNIRLISARLIFQYDKSIALILGAPVNHSEHEGMKQLTRLRSQPDNMA